MCVFVHFGCLERVFLHIIGQCLYHMHRDTLVYILLFYVCLSLCMQNGDGIAPSAEEGVCVCVCVSQCQCVPSYAKYSYQPLVEQKCISCFSAHLIDCGLSVCARASETNVSYTQRQGSAGSETAPSFPFTLAQVSLKMQWATSGWG